jgi:hypothetical protein
LQGLRAWSPSSTFTTDAAKLGTIDGAWALGGVWSPAWFWALVPRQSVQYEHWHHLFEAMRIACVLAFRYHNEMPEASCFIKKRGLFGLVVLETGSPKR